MKKILIVFGLVIAFNLISSEMSQKEKSERELKQKKEDLKKKFPILIEEAYGRIDNNKLIELLNDLKKDLNNEPQEEVVDAIINEIKSNNIDEAFNVINGLYEYTTDQSIQNKINNIINIIKSRDSDSATDIYNYGFPRDISNLILDYVKPFQYEEELILDAHKEHKRPHVQLKWSHDNEYLASASYNEIKIWDIQDGTLKDSLIFTNGKMPRNINWSPDNKIIAFTLKKDTVIWNLATKEHNIIEDVTHFSWSPSSEINLVAYFNVKNESIDTYSYDKTNQALLKNKQTSFKIDKFMEDDIIGNINLIWSNDGRRIALQEEVNSDRSEFCLASSISGRKITNLNGVSRIENLIGFNNLGELFISTNNDRFLTKVKFYDNDKNKSTKTTIPYESFTKYNLINDKLILDPNDKQIYIYDINSYALLTTIDLKEKVNKYISSIDLTSDESKIAIALDNGEILIYSMTFF